MDIVLQICVFLMMTAVGLGLTQDDFRHCIDGKSTGAVRVSCGIASNFADAYRFVEFASTFTDRQACR